MRMLLIAGVVFVGSTADAQSIFPNGGAVRQTPTLWISADHMPRVEVTAKGSPVVFELDESPMERGLRRIALRPQVADGPFTVTLDGRPIHFEADASLDREDDEYTSTEFTRIAIEWIRGRDTLVIDARTERETTLYFLNHSSSRSSGDDVFARYVWSGAGRVIEPGVEDYNQWKNGVVRFAVPLAELGVSCASTGKIELSPYTTHTSASTTLHPIATLELANGKVRLPVELFDVERETVPWVPCVGATTTAPPKVEAPPRVEPPPPGSGIFYPPTGAEGGIAALTASGAFSSSFCEEIYGPLVGPDYRLALPPALSPSEDGVSGEETELLWWSAPLVLLGVALAMWRATSRAAA